MIKDLYGYPVLNGNSLEIRILSPNGSMKTTFLKINGDGDELEKKVAELIAEHTSENVFFGVATRSSEAGKQENCSFLTSFYVDIDEYNGKKFKNMPPEEREPLINKLIQELRENKLKPTHIVSSGNGIHSYWRLSEPVDVQRNIEKIKTVLKSLADLLVEFKGDPACTTIAQVLRLPGSNNVKDPNNVKKCELLYKIPDLTYDFDALAKELNVFEAFVDDSAAGDEAFDIPDEEKGLYAYFKKNPLPMDKLRDAVMECNFFKDMFDKPDMQTYQLWTYMSSNLSVFHDAGLTIFHEISKGYPTYDQKKTDKIFKDMGKKIKTGEMGPVTCNTICGGGYSCSKKCKQTSPAGMIYSITQPKGAAASDKNYFISVANAIMSKRKIMNIKGVFYEFKDGFWQQMGDGIRKLIIEELGTNYKKSWCEEVLYYLLNKTTVNPDEVNNNGKQNIVCLKNGMLKIDNNAAPVLLPFAPEYYSINQIDITYDQSAKCPLWLKFLDQTFAKLKPEDRKITIEALKHFFGYLLLPGNSFQKIAFFIGAPRSGKSAIISTINALIGDKNVSGMAFKNLSKETNLAILFGKLANICGELDADDYYSAATLKQLCGEDKISGRFLYKDPISFYNEAKLIAAGNFFPRVKDNSGAFKERILAFPCDNQVPPTKRDQDLKKKLQTELPAILNWAIEGRITLFQTGHFVESEPMIALKQEISEDNSTIEAWFESNKESLFQKRLITLQAGYNEYKIFCENEGEKNEKKRVFMRTISKFNGVRVFQKSKPDQYMIEFCEGGEDKAHQKADSANRKEDNIVPLRPELSDFIPEPEDGDEVFA